MTPHAAISSPGSDADLLDWLRLIRSQNIGPHTFWDLLSRYGTAADALHALPEIASRAGRRGKLKLASLHDAQQEYEKLHAYGARLVPCGDPAYPSLLAQVEAPPPLLTVLGNAAIAGARSIGIVGARNASASGRKMAAMMAEGLGRQGVTIISGLARGIDTQAHIASLATGTVAVTAGGIDVIYPRENKDLHTQISTSGAVVTEMPFGAEPLARYFPRRNRLISGMSAGVIVIEAAIRSGSLITARFALEQGRDVFAVPGSPLDQRARGTNELIRNGATLVQSAEDVLDEIEARFSEPDQPYLFAAAADTHPASVPETAAYNDDQARKAVTELLSSSPVDIDDIARLSGLPVSRVLGIIMELEIAGRALRHPGSRVSAG